MTSVVRGSQSSASSSLTAFRNHRSSWKPLLPLVLWQRYYLLQGIIQTSHRPGWKTLFGPESIPCVKKLDPYFPCQEDVSQGCYPEGVIVHPLVKRHPDPLREEFLVEATKVATCKNSEWYPLTATPLCTLPWASAW